MTDITLSDMQWDAVKAAKKWFDVSIPGKSDSFYLAGLAGSGKSTVLPDIVDYLGIDPTDVEFLAPTGRAARVMTKKLRVQFGRTALATTIHKSIYIPSHTEVDRLLKLVEQLQHYIINEPGAELKQPIAGTLLPDVALAAISKRLDSAYGDDQHSMPHFMVNMESKLRERRLIICDEASMVGSRVAADLKSFGIPILALGDPGQLPPVRDTAGLSDGEPDFFLSEIHRQAADNPIIRIAHQLRKGIYPQYGHYDGLVHVVTPQDDEWTVNPDYNGQVIAGTHKKRFILTDKIRKSMGFTSDGPMEDELLIVKKNSKRHPDLVNGTPVWCTKSSGADEDGSLTSGYSTMDLSIEDEDTGLKYDVTAVQGLFEEQQFHKKGKHTCSGQANHFAKVKHEHVEFGWVITGHSSQGSQWENVIVHDESQVFREAAHKWAYTCCTRAEKELVWVMR